MMQNIELEPRDIVIVLRHVDDEHFSYHFHTELEEINSTDPQTRAAMLMALLLKDESIFNFINGILQVHIDNAGSPLTIPNDG